MTKTAAHVDEDVLALKGAKLLLKREDGEPRSAGSALDCHDLLQGAEAFRLGWQPHESRQIRRERFLKGCLCSIVHISVLGFGEERWERIHNWADIVKEMVYAAAIPRLCQCSCDGVGGEGIGTGLVYHTHRGHIS